MPLSSYLHISDVDCIDSAKLRRVDLEDLNHEKRVDDRIIVIILWVHDILLGIYHAKPMLIIIEITKEPSVVLKEGYIVVYHFDPIMD